VIPHEVTAGANDWLDDAWQSLPERSATVLTGRVAGHTLAELGGAFGLTRERVRQLQLKAERDLVRAQRRHAPELLEKLTVMLGELPAVADDEVSLLLVTRASYARQALFRSLGIARPRTMSGDLQGWWTRHPAALESRLRELSALAPMTDEELQASAAELALPAALPLEDLLQSPESKLTHHSAGWIRTARAGRDLAYLWLRREGEPRTATDIAEVTDTSEHAIRETMRRDEAFAQVRPEGTWALRDWRLPGAADRYTNAVEVVVDVLRDLGPLTYEQLRAESQQRYPVSAWRISQCLSSHLVGLTPNGRFDLTERGAIPIEDPEPRQPTTIKVSGQVVGVALNVDSELLRGSGIGVSRWLTWYLGLRTAPSARYFKLTDSLGEIVVKRNTSLSQLSSLRAAALSMDLVEGCKIALVLNLDTDTASIRHACSPGACPAR